MLVPWGYGVEWGLEQGWVVFWHLTWDYRPAHGHINQFLMYCLDFHGLYWELRHPAHKKTPWTVLTCEQNQPLAVIRCKHAQFKNHINISSSGICTTRCYSSAQRWDRHSLSCKKNLKSNDCIYNRYFFFLLSFQIINFCLWIIYLLFFFFFFLVQWYILKFVLQTF